MTLLIEKGAAETSEAAIRQAYNDWAKAFHSHDINGIMSMYAPGVVAYDFVSPLQYVGKEAYRKDYEEFLNQFEGPIEVEFRDMKVVAGGDVGFVYALEHISGTMKNGQKIDFWGRCTSGFEKISGKWLDTHDHCSVPADFDTGKALLDLKP
jgi:ketosteroid isomerase-like protein